MPALQIRHRTGRIETRELSKDVPLLVGQLASNDIEVDADGVAPVHCRISWKRKNFEVAAVSPEGVQWNGKTVNHSVLSPGDVIRVGDVDIVLLAEARGRDAHDHPAQSETPLAAGEKVPFRDASTSQFELRPISEAMLPVRPIHAASRFAGDSNDKKQPAVPAADVSASPQGAALRGEDRNERHGGLSRAARVALDLNDLADEERSAPALDWDGRPAAPAAGKVALGARVRPGERDPLRSPLVIGLLSGSLILLLSAATLWFVLSREKAQKQYDLAQSQLASGQYAEAIKNFDLFLTEYPRHALAASARAAIGTAGVEQAIGGGSPAWDKGLEALQAYLDQNRDSKSFQDADSPVRKFVLQSADRIASGAVDAARQLHKRPLLSVYADAIKLIELYSPADNRPEARLKELAGAARIAEIAILQQEAFDAAAKKIDAALGEKHPAEALREYRRILDRYATAIDYRPLSDRSKKALELERSLTARDDAPREPPPAASPAYKPARQLTLARRTRARSDVPSTGTTVFALAEDCLYGVDSATGEPQWRQVVGLDPPFAPVVVSAGQPAILVFDGRSRELLLLGQRAGEVLWRLPLAARPRGAPRVHEGQVYLTTEDDVLEQVDLLTGRSASRLTFSQTVVGPCAVSFSGERLYLAGDENVLYVLSRRPLACEQIVWLGHAPGAIQAPLIAMRNLLLLAENDRQNSCRLHLFDTAPEDRPPAEIATHRVDGHVRDLPALRGKELFVPSTNERVSAFLIAETGDKEALAFVAAFQVKDPHGSPVFLATGPDDQMWMYSSALRRFELTRNSLLPAKQELAVGLASQPLQSFGDSLFLGRRLPYSRAVLFSEADRHQMVAQWQVSLGAGILECTAPAGQDQSVVCVTTLGDLFQVTPQKLARGGFELQSLGQLPVPEGLSEALDAVRLSDGRLAVYCSGDKPRLWLPGSDGMSREHKLSQRLEAPPVRMAGGLLLGLPGRLRLFGRTGGGPPVEDLPAPIGHDEAPRWLTLAALDENQAVVLSEQGRIARIQFGTAPVPHLEEITHWDAARSVDLPMAHAAGRLYLVDSASRLVALEAGSLEPVGEVVLEAAPAARPRPVEGQVLVELETGRLVSYDVAAKLAKKWDIPLGGASLTGDPLAVDGQLLIALSDGRVVWLDPATGQVARKLDLRQQLAFGPQKWGENIVVGSLDGTLVVVNGQADAAQ